MSDELKDLQKRISNLSDDELLKMIHINYADYREEAINIAKEEIKKRNIPEIDDRKKDELRSKTAVELPLRWLKFYTYFRLPLALAISLILMAYYLDPMKVMGVVITALISILMCVVFIGLHKRRFWGWKLNLVLLVVETVLNSIGRAKDFEDFSIVLIGGALIWFLPNYIYFNKRRYLFHK